MKAQKFEELKALADEELVLREKTLRESLFKIRMRLAIGQMSKMADVMATKRNLARVLTVMRQRQMQAAKKTFDVVVLDPPKLIATLEGADEGRMKYFDLNRLALTAVKPGGMLVTCSCSGLLSPEEFFTVVRGAARGARRRVQTLRLTGAGADHPVMTDCPESAYLKCIWARVW